MLNSVIIKYFLQFHNKNLIKMNSKILLVVIVLICSVAAEKEEKKKKVWKCKDHEVKLTDTEKEGIETCFKESMERMKAEKKEKKEKKGDEESKKEKDGDEETKKDKKKCGHGNFKIDPCMIACKMEKLKQVSDDKVNTAAIDKFVDAAFHESVKEDLKKALKACADEVKEKLSTANKCESYKTFGECQMTAMQKICKNKKEE